MTSNCADYCETLHAVVIVLLFFASNNKLPFVSLNVEKLGVGE